MNMSKGERVAATLRLPKYLHTQVKRKAAERNMPMSDFIVEALKRQLGKKTTPKKS
jgi:predicted DNA binding CopG/RHH family protein